MEDRVLTDKAKEQAIYEALMQNNEELLYSLLMDNKEVEDIYKTKTSIKEDN